VDEENSRTPLLFYSYAHEDAGYLAGLRKHLMLLRHAHKISDWHDREIPAGGIWDLSIKDQLERAQIILFLVSVDFIASEYCWGTEVRRAMERRERNEAIVIPVIIRPTDDWESAPFGILKALPTDGKPISLWRNRDQAWADVAAGIRSVVDRLNR
jgi:hypothetical protein